MAKARRGRAKATGCYATRQELVVAICENYYYLNFSEAAAARHCQVSPGVAKSILEGDEGLAWRQEEGLSRP